MHRSLAANARCDQNRLEPALRNPRVVRANSVLKLRGPRRASDAGAQRVPSPWALQVFVPVPVPRDPILAQDIAQDIVQKGGKTSTFSTRQGLHLPSRRWDGHHTYAPAAQYLHYSRTTEPLVHNANGAQRAIHACRPPKRRITLVDFRRLSTWLIRTGRLCLPRPALDSTNLSATTWDPTLDYIRHDSRRCGHAR